MHTWTWRSWEGGTYLTCSLLNAWPHGFFSRHVWPQMPSELVYAMQPSAEVYRVRQVHGNEILSSTEVRTYLTQVAPPSPQSTNGHATPPAFPEADGLLSDGDNQSVWVCTADCTPVLIADEHTGQVAAVHAGWRGTAAKIVGNAIARMQSQGSRMADLRVAMGPAIAGEVYQVAVEVAAQVGETLVNGKLDSDGMERVTQITEQLMQLPHPPVLDDAKPGHVRLDVRRVNALQLERLGLSPEQIAIAPHCTYQEPGNFFSYRRDARKQVQWSGIVSGGAS